MRNLIEDWPPILFRPEDHPADEICQRFVRQSKKWRFDHGRRIIVPDDGAPGYAFGLNNFAIHIDVPYRENIIAAWRRVPQEEGKDYFDQFDSVWHYQTRNGKAEWGESYPDRDQHPNEQASREMMHYISRLFGAANGHSIYDMERKTGSLCAWCKHGQHRRDRLENLRDYYQRLKGHAEKEKAQAEARQLEEERNIEFFSRMVQETETDLTAWEAEK